MDRPYDAHEDDYGEIEYGSWEELRANEELGLSIHGDLGADFYVEWYITQEQFLEDLVEKFGPPISGGYIPQELRV